MPLSKHWNNDIINDWNRARNLDHYPFNDDCMCMFTGRFDGRVNRCVAVFAKQNGNKEGLLYNNRLYLSILNKKECHKKQYEANRKWIIDYFQKLK